MRLVFAFLALLLLAPLAPSVQAEGRGPHEGAMAGGSAWQTWGVIGAQLDPHTGAGVRYWRNSTGEESLFLYATVCVQLDSGKGYCDRTPLRA